MDFPPLPPGSRPDAVVAGVKQAFPFPAGRPAMPSAAAGIPPLSARWLLGRRRVESAGRGPRGSQATDGAAGPDTRTDMAIEAYQAALDRAPGTTIPGVEREQRSGRHATVQRVRITSPQGAATLGKAEGTYSTVEAEALRERSQEAREEVARFVAEELSAMLQQQGVPVNAPVLVAGLGNWNATPDSLGPRVVGQLLVTRHLHALLPAEKRGALRPVAAFSPGVLGLTGIETMELVAAAVDRVRPAALICVDALAAGSPERLCTTVQLSDAGIQPGAGVGNVRRALSRRELGIPVIAMGMPTVIYARRLVQPDGTAPPAPRAFPPLFHYPPAGAAQMGPSGEPRADAGADWLASLVVTPKDIDVFIEDAAELLAGAVNTALHPGLDLDEVLSYIQ